MKEIKNLEDVLDEQFPKGECKERGNALVLYSMFQIEFKEFIKELKEEIDNELLIKDNILRIKLKKIIDKLSSSVFNRKGKVGK